MLKYNYHEKSLEHQKYDALMRFLFCFTARSQTHEVPLAYSRQSMVGPYLRYG